MVAQETTTCNDPHELEAPIHGGHIITMGKRYCSKRSRHSNKSFLFMNSLTINGNLSCYMFMSGRRIRLDRNIGDDSLGILILRCFILHSLCKKTYCLKEH